MSGAGYFTSNGNSKLTTDLTWPLPLPPVPLPDNVREEDDSNADHKDAYVYANIPWGDKLTVTAGASYDDISFDWDIKTTTTFVGLPIPPATTDASADFSLNKFNPKLGLTWRALENTTLRAAAFQTVARDWRNTQTIEPTQVAGFNQFYNDAFGTKSTNYGLALDQVFSANFAAGLEYSWRDLTVPHLVHQDTSSSWDLENWDADVGRAYLYWTPTLRLAASAEYLYEDTKRQQSFTGEFPATQVHTHRVPLTINYFHPLGYFTRLRTTYIDQDGKFTSKSGSIPNASTTHENDQFWLVDASVGYRLPKRHGFISAGVGNLFDKKFNFVDTDPYDPQIVPDRFFFTRLTLSF